MRLEALQFVCVLEIQTASSDQESTADEPSVIDVFVILIHSWVNPFGLSGIRTIPQNNHQQYRDEVSIVIIGAGWPCSSTTAAVLYTVTALQKVLNPDLYCFIRCWLTIPMAHDAVNHRANSVGFFHPFARFDSLPDFLLPLTQQCQFVLGCLLMPSIALLSGVHKPSRICKYS